MKSRIHRICSLFRGRAMSMGMGIAMGLCSLLADPSSAHAETTVGASLENPGLRDGDNKPANLPSFGEKVLLILYTDPDVADQNDAFADFVKAADLPRTHFQSMGVANMQDAPAKPNWIIRTIVRGKIKKYNVTILTDPERLLIKAWDLGDCNNKSVVMIVGKDKKLHFFAKGKLSDTQKSAALAKLCELIAQDGGPSVPACTNPPKPAN